MNLNELSSFAMSRLDPGCFLSNWKISRGCFQRLQRAGLYYFFSTFLQNAFEVAWEKKSDQ